MNKNLQQPNQDVAISRLTVLVRILESDPEIIDLLPAEDVSAELREMGIDPRPSNLIEIAKTTSKGQSVSVEDKTRLLFEAAKEEIFEDGIESNLTRGLSELVAAFGTQTIATLVRLINTEGCNEEIAAEALRWLGRVNHNTSYEARFQLLVKSLTDPSPRIRDAASVALAFLDDQRAVPALRAAIAREQLAELRTDMEQVLTQLESGG